MKYIIILSKEVKKNDILGEDINNPLIIDNNDDITITKHINTSLELSSFEEELRNNIIRHHIENGIYIENPKTTIIGPKVIIMDNTKIYQGSRILGDTLISKDTIIGPNSNIIDSFIDEGSSIINSQITNSKIGKNTKVGPFANIRMDSVIGDNDRIGNYVEIKKSKIGNNTNASHLAYIGDTLCGNNVNFGCGSITVNYDGKNKHQTKIGNNVFIGCNSNLIAPITIGNGSYIAAQTTLTRSLNEFDFAISRNTELIKNGYSLKYHKEDDLK